MKAARVRARHAIPLLLALLALAPTTVLAFNPPSPGNPGRHIGELLHNPHLQPAPGQGGGGSGGPSDVTNALRIVSGGGPSNTFPTITVPMLQLRPALGGGPRALTASSNVGQDSVLVVVLLAALIAANVVLGIVYTARGVNYLVRQALTPAPAAA